MHWHRSTARCQEIAEQSLPCPLRLSLFINRKPADIQQAQHLGKHRCRAALAGQRGRQPGAADGQRLGAAQAGRQAWAPRGRASCHRASSWAPWARAQLRSAPADSVRSSPGALAPADSIATYKGSGSQRGKQMLSITGSVQVCCYGSLRKHAYHGP